MHCWIKPLKLPFTAILITPLSILWNYAMIIGYNNASFCIANEIGNGLFPRNLLRILFEILYFSMKDMSYLYKYKSVKGKQKRGKTNNFEHRKDSIHRMSPTYFRFLLSHFIIKM